MTDQEIKEEAEREARAFLGDLKGGKLELSRVPNKEDDYTENFQKRDTKAVQNFIGTPLFEQIMHGEVYEP